MTDVTSIAGSNSLPELAARIKAEHEACTAALQRGLEHAVAAGRLLIEAKARLKHGEWLPWLRQCAIPERTAQAYMQVARSFAKLDDVKSATVADLSFRDALHSLAATGSILRQLPPESYDRALLAVEDPENAETLAHAVRRVRIEDREARNRGMLEMPASMLPTNGRKIRVARNPKRRQWLLAIGPDITRTALKEKEQAARATETVSQLEQEQSELLSRAEALEAEAKALREDAGIVSSLIAAEVKKTIGPVAPFAETYDFQCDEQTDAELARLPQRQLVDRLLSARGTVGEGLEETERGYWGDMTLMSSQQINPGPDGPRASGWTKIGSAEWLEGMFPNLNEPLDARQAEIEAAKDAAQ